MNFLHENFSVRVVVAAILKTDKPVGNSVSVMFFIYKFD